MFVEGSMFVMISWSVVMVDIYGVCFGVRSDMFSLCAIGIVPWEWRDKSPPVYG